MKQATISQIKDRLSAYLKEVEAGETILILNRDRPVARLEPVRGRTREAEEGRLVRLERQGLLRRAELGPDRALAGVSLAAAPPGAELLRAVLDEREHGW
jgi:prevent-host-death family protein